MRGGAVYERCALRTIETLVWDVAGGTALAVVDGGPEETDEALCDLDYLRGGCVWW